jgi:hypothetical protein
LWLAPRRELLSPQQPILAEVNTRPVDNDRQQEKRQKRKERKTAATQRLLRQKDRVSLSHARSFSA